MFHERSYNPLKTRILNVVINPFEDTYITLALKTIIKITIGII